MGLAAPQVGVNVRLMVFNPTGKRGDKEYVLVNPQIISSNKTQEVIEEGCLSFPQIFADVEVSSFQTPQERKPKTSLSSEGFCGPCRGQLWCK